DPAEVRTEAGAPDDVPDLEDPAAVEHRQPVLDARSPPEHPFHAHGAQIRSPVAEKRRAAAPDLRPHLPAQRRVDGQDVRPGEEETAEESTSAPALDRGRQLPRVATGQHDLVLRSGLEGDVGAGVTGADDEHRAVTTLPEVPVRRRL